MSVLGLPELTGSNNADCPESDALRSISKAADPVSLSLFSLPSGGGASRMQGLVSIEDGDGFKVCAGMISDARRQEA
jgi:hypothetical protein